MNTKQAYDSWAEQYDTNNNKTRDLEALALRTTLANIDFDACLEIGCGTGKNTEYFITKAKQINAVDLSDEMLAKAKSKIISDKVQFIQTDITKPWDFTDKKYNLISFSLVLEHIENLEPVFNQVSKALVTGGHVYVGELHPFKQYTGTKARFDTAEGTQIVNCFNHHISDFTSAAKKHRLEVSAISEYFDDNDRAIIPRILTLLLTKI
jgi:ubiquinone/menaquinone biosynthesis C-methylase UbiE